MMASTSVMCAHRVQRCAPRDLPRRCSLAAQYCARIRHMSRVYQMGDHGSGFHEMLTGESLADETARSMPGTAAPKFGLTPPPRGWGGKG